MARACDAEITLQQLVVVEAEISDAVARLDPFGRQPGGQPFAALAELGVGERWLPETTPVFGRTDRLRGAGTERE